MYVNEVKKILRLKQNRVGKTYGNIDKNGLKNKPKRNLFNILSPPLSRKAIKKNYPMGHSRKI